MALCESTLWKNSNSTWKFKKFTTDVLSSNLFLFQKRTEIFFQIEISFPTNFMDLFRPILKI